MNIEVGKTYEDGLGYSILIVNERMECDDPCCQFLGSNGLSYMSDGRFLDTENLPVNQLDLIKSSAKVSEGFWSIDETIRKLNT